MSPKIMGIVATKLLIFARAFFLSDFRTGIFPIYEWRAADFRPGLLSRWFSLSLFQVHKPTQVYLFRLWSRYDSYLSHETPLIFARAFFLGDFREGLFQIYKPTHLSLIRLWPLRNISGVLTNIMFCQQLLTIPLTKKIRNNAPNVLLGGERTMRILMGF